MRLHDQRDTHARPPAFRLPGRGRILIGAAAVFVWTGMVAIVAEVANPAEALFGWAADRGYMVGHSGGLLLTSASYPVRKASALGSRSAAPLITLDIKFTHIMRLRAQKAAALERGVLIQGDDDFVPVSIRFEGRTMSGQIRLKGDLVDHLQGDNWAFRVKLKNSDHLLGMRRFSLHHPLGRDYQGEPLFLEAVRSEGILAPRYQFADVVMNGEKLGRMALEEHFSTELLESQERRESVIVRFDESRFWANGNPRYLDSHINAMVSPFRDSAILLSDVLTSDLRHATGLLRGLVEGTLPASQVFDVKLMGRFLAVANAWGSEHTLRWNNLRFYYNPITAVLEPVAYDAMVGHESSAELVYLGRSPLVAAVLEDTLVRREYEETLERWAAPGHERWSALAARQQDYLSQLRWHYPLVPPFDLARVAQRAREVLDLQVQAGQPSSATVHDILQAYVVEDQGAWRLELANMLPGPVEIMDVFWRSDDSVAVPFTAKTPLALPLVMDGTPYGEPLKVGRWTYSPPVGVSDSTIWIVARRRGESATQTVPTSRYFPRVNSQLEGRSVEQVVARHPYLRWNPGDRVFTVASGRHRVARSIVLPDGVGLTIQAGATMEFSPDAAVVVRGPLHINGTADQPVRLHGFPGDSGPGPWPGIAVIGADTPSRWSYAQVIGTTGIDQPDWHLSSGATFYASEVHIDHSAFRDNLTEDVLNVVRSQFTLTDVEFTNAASDGLDADFSDGEISGGRFHRIGWIGGGDAIDVSGAEVVVDGVEFTEIGDKAISVGERSSLTVRNIVVRGASAGVVSKDQSRVTVTQSQFTNIELAALMAYIKKVEYGPAALRADDIRLDNVVRDTWVQTGSVITLNGQTAVTEAVNVDSLYSTVMAKGLTRR